MNTYKADCWIRDGQRDGKDIWIRRQYTIHASGLESARTLAKQHSGAEFIECDIWADLPSDEVDLIE